MTQNINLLGPAFRKQHLLLTLERALLLSGLVLVTMLALQWYGQQQVNGLRQELTSAQGLLKAQSAYTNRLKGQGPDKQGISALDTEIQRLEMELKSVRESIAILEGGVLGNREGFARYLLAFSRQIVDGLWLTGFTVGGAGDVAIQGRVLRPELVPVYIQKLNREPALQGREFSTLQMRRPVVRPGPGAAESNAAEPRFLEFALSTAVQAAADAGGGAR